MLSLTLKGFFEGQEVLLWIFAFALFPVRGARRGVCRLRQCFVLVRFALCESRIYEIFDRVFIDTLRPPKTQNP